MEHEESLIQAAHLANDAVWETMRDYRLRYVFDEDDITGFLVGALSVKLNGTIGHLSWSASILRHRKGVAAEEKRFGADILIHVGLQSASLAYSKGVLVQAKRFDRHLFPSQQRELVGQCNKMLSVTPASFVFGYSRSGMRCAPATTFIGYDGVDFYAQCVWTSYRFFQELFRCPIGDPRITSANVADLPVPTVFLLKASDGTEPRRSEPTVAPLLPPSGE